MCRSAHCRAPRTALAKKSSSARPSGAWWAPIRIGVELGLGLGQKLGEGEALTDGAAVGSKMSRTFSRAQSVCQAVRPESGSQAVSVCVSVSVESISHYQPVNQNGRTLRASMCTNACACASTQPMHVHTYSMVGGPLCDDLPHLLPCVHAHQADWRQAGRLPLGHPVRAGEGLDSHEDKVCTHTHTARETVGGEGDERGEDTRRSE